MVKKYIEGIRNLNCMPPVKKDNNGKIISTAALVQKLHKTMKK